MATEDETKQGDQDYLKGFVEEGILLAAHGRVYPYASGGVGPYYIDLRRAPSDPAIMKAVTERYVDALASLGGAGDKQTAFVGVPTTGVVYATALALKNGHSPLVVMEKLNPERLHVYSPEAIMAKVQEEVNSLKLASGAMAFLGLEDSGVVAATAAGWMYERPCAIMRRVQKEHGTSRTVEADLHAWASRGVKHLVVFNDTILPVPEEEVAATLASVPGASAFASIRVVSVALRPHPSPVEYLKDFSLVEVEDLWTTGTSALTLHKNITRVLGHEPAVLVFLDRLQGAARKFDLLAIKARAVTTIGAITDFLLAEEEITAETHKEITLFRRPFTMPNFLEQLVVVNDTSVCVGLDITPAKFPLKPEDTTLPRFDAYTSDEAGVWAYTTDLLDALLSATVCRVFKPNLAYFNAIAEAAAASGTPTPPLNAILDMINTRVRDVGGLVILDAKIGDIGRTMGQYAARYKDFAAVTVHPYMGEDSLNPVLDTPMGAFVLVFTSNPSRVDFETQRVIPVDLLKEALAGDWTAHALAAAAPPMYTLVAEKVVEWNKAREGCVGAVVGGTRNAAGTLTELECCVGIFMRGLGYLPPLLIPGVGTQGGTAEEVVTTIVGALANAGLDEVGIRAQFRRVLINSASAIDYSPRPADAANLLVKEVADALDAAIASIVVD